MANRFDKRVKDKKKEESLHTKDSLDSRHIQHQKTNMCQVEIVGWVGVVRVSLLSIFLICGIIKAILFSNDYVKQIVDLLTTSNHFITQITISVLILGILLIKKL